MTPEAQRIAIAEACGWKMFPAGKDSFGIYCEAHANKDHQTILQTKLPDYLNDLNAAIPLLNLIPCLGWRVQRFYDGEKGCWVIISNPSSEVASDCIDAVVVNGETFSKAICEVFIRSIGKWTE